MTQLRFEIIPGRKALKTEALLSASASTRPGVIRCLRPVINRLARRLPANGNGDLRAAALREASGWLAAQTSPRLEALGVPADIRTELSATLPAPVAPVGFRVP